MSNKKLNFKDEDPIKLSDLIYKKISKAVANKTIIETLISKSILNSNEYAANEKIKKNYI